jgi:hypothetical protein
MRNSRTILSETLMRVVTTLMLAPALLAAHARSAALDIKEGLWEITVKMEMTAMPAGVPAQILHQCITGKDLDDPRRMTYAGGPHDERCRFSDYRVQGNTATWSWACTGEGAMTGNGTLTFSGTFYKGTNRISMQHTGPVKHTTMHYTGRRLGDCKNN